MSSPGLPLFTHWAAGQWAKRHCPDRETAIVKCERPEGAPPPGLKPAGSANPPPTGADPCIRPLPGRPAPIDAEPRYGI